MFETCNCQSFLIPELLASALLFTFVENELSLEPWLFRNFFTFGSHTRQSWFTTHRQHHALIHQLEKFSMLTNSC